MKDITIDSSLATVLKAGPKAPVKAGKGEGQSFDDVLKNIIPEVNRLQKEAAAASDELLRGGGSIHETMIAMEKAGLSFRYMMKVRNKILDAYKEVMKMPV